MRIITDGERYAVARGRWLFTQVLSFNGLWWSIYSQSAKAWCWNDINTIKLRLKKYKKIKWKDYKVTIDGRTPHTNGLSGGLTPHTNKENNDN